MTKDTFDRLMQGLKDIREGNFTVARTSNNTDPVPETGLLPCPFCGGAPKLLATDDLICTGCGLVATMATREETITKWNRRVALQPK